MRIAVFTDMNTVNSVYRAFPVTELVDRGHGVTVETRNTAIDERERQALGRCDVAFFYRYTGKAIEQLVGQLQAMGVAVVWDNDDNLNETPEAAKGANTRGALRDQRLRRELQQMVRLADLVTTPSAALAELYSSWGANAVRVVENYVPKNLERPAPRPHEGIVIGWTAAGEHVHDMQALGVDRLLGELLDRRSDVHVRTIGIDLRLAHQRYERRPLIQYHLLAHEIAGFDVGLAPLDDIAFNRARSNVKLKEYAVCGVPWLASPVGPYLGMGEKQGGRLVADDDWAAALDRLVTRGRERGKLAKKSRAWGERQWAVRNLDVWEAALQEAIERARARTPAAPAR